jgi:hypothetical protein
MNELLLIVEMIIVFLMVVLSKKFFGKNGLYIWIAIASIIANIQVTKSVTILGISATLGNVLFSSNFLATDILTECYGLKEAKKGVFISFFAIVCYVILSQITLLFTPNEIDTVHSAMRVLFGLTPRVCISSITMSFLANFADVYLYNYLMKKFDGKVMWLRNNISTIICNCLENFLFVFLAFFCVYTVKELVMISISTCIIEIIVAICDTPFLYLAKKIKSNED